MGFKKEFTAEDLTQINEAFVSAYNSWVDCWSISMKGFRIDSKEYRTICRIGRDMLKVNYALDNLPGNEGKIKTKTFCGFN